MLEAQMRKERIMSGQQWMTTLVLLVCAATDLIGRSVYRWLVLLYMLLAAAGRLTVGEHLSAAVLLADLLPGGCALLLAKVTGEGIGYGDAMLILACGLSAGRVACMEMTMNAFFLAGVAAFFLILIGRGRGRTLPFVPFLLAGWIVSLVQ